MLNILKKSIAVILCAQLVMPPQTLSLISFAWAADQPASEVTKLIPMGSPSNAAAAAVANKEAAVKLAEENPGPAKSSPDATKTAEIKVVLTIKQGGIPENDKYIEALKKRMQELILKSVNDRIKLIDEKARQLNDPATSEEEKNTIRKERDALIKEEYLADQQLKAAKKALTDLDYIANSIAKYPKLWGITDFDDSGNATITCTITEESITFRDKNGKIISRDGKGETSTRVDAKGNINAQISIAGTPIKKYIEAATLSDPIAFLSPENLKLLNEASKEIKSLALTQAESAKKFYATIIDLMKVQAAEPAEVTKTSPEATPNAPTDQNKAKEWLTKLDLFITTYVMPLLDSASESEIPNMVFKAIVDSTPAAPEVPASTAGQPNSTLLGNLQDLGIDPSKAILEAEKIKAQEDLKKAEAALKKLQDSDLNTEEKMRAAQEKVNKAQANFNNAKKDLEEAGNVIAQARLAMQKQALDAKTFVPFLGGNTYQYTDPANPKNTVLGTQFNIPIPDKATMKTAKDQADATSLLVGSLAFAKGCEIGAAPTLGDEEGARKWGAEFKKSMDKFKETVDDMTNHPENYPPLKAGDKVIVLVDTVGNIIFKNASGDTIKTIPPVAGGSKDLLKDLKDVLSEPNKNFAVKYSTENLRIGVGNIYTQLKKQQDYDKKNKTDSGSVFKDGVVGSAAVKKYSLAAVDTSEFVKAKKNSEDTLAEAKTSFQAADQKHSEAVQLIEDTADAVATAKEKVKAAENELALASELDAAKKAQLIIDQKIERSAASIKRESEKIARLENDLKELQDMGDLENLQAELDDLVSQRTKLEAEREALLQENERLAAQMKQNEEENLALTKEFNETDPKKIIDPIIVPDPKKGLDYIDDNKLEFFTPDESAGMNEMSPGTGDATKTSILGGAKESPSDMRTKIKFKKMTPAEYTAKLERAHKLLQNEIATFRAKKQIEANKKKVYDELIPQLTAALEEEADLREETANSAKQHTEKEESLERSELNITLHQLDLEAANAEKASSLADQRKEETVKEAEKTSKAAADAAAAASNAAQINVDAEIAAVNARIAAEKAQIGAAKAKADYDTMLKKEAPANNKLDARIKKAETDGNTIASALFKARKTYDAADTAANKKALDNANAKQLANAKLQKDLNDKLLALDASKATMVALKEAADLAVTNQTDADKAFIATKAAVSKKNTDKKLKDKAAADANLAANTAEKNAAKLLEEFNTAQQTADETRDKTNASVAVKAGDQYDALKSEARGAKEKADRASKEADRLRVLSDDANAKAYIAMNNKEAADKNKDEASKKYDDAKTAYDQAVKLKKLTQSALNKLKDELNDLQTTSNNARLYASDLAVVTARTDEDAARAVIAVDYARVEAENLAKITANASANVNTAKENLDAANDATTPEAKAAVVTEAAQKAADEQAAVEAAKKAANEAAAAAEQAAIDAIKAAEEKIRQIVFEALKIELAENLKILNAAFEKQRVAFNNYLKNTPVDKRPGGLQAVKPVEKLDLVSISVAAFERALRSLADTLKKNDPAVLAANEAANIKAADQAAIANNTPTNSRQPQPPPMKTIKPITVKLLPTTPLTDKERFDMAIAAMRSQILQMIDRHLTSNKDNPEMGYSMVAQKFFDMGPVAAQEEIAANEKSRKESLALQAKAEKAAAKPAKTTVATKPAATASTPTYVTNNATPVIKPGTVVVVTKPGNGLINPPPPTPYNPGAGTPTSTPGSTTTAGANPAGGSSSCMDSNGVKFC